MIIQNDLRDTNYSQSTMQSMVDVLIDEDPKPQKDKVKEARQDN